MNKVATLDDLVGALSGAETVSFGGGGIVRKPMAAAAAMGLSSAAPKSVMALLGGPEIDLLIGMGKVKDLLFAYVGLDSAGLAPNFRRARETGRLAVTESSEYLFLSGLEASARGVPFLPSVSGLGTDVLTRPNTPYRTFNCPLTNRTLVAAPAIRPDVAVIHVNVADQRGNAVIYGEVFADFLLARAAQSVWLTTECVMEQLPPIDDRPAGYFIPRVLVAGVVDAPGGADFTGIYPDYAGDAAAAESYRDNATDPGWLAAYAERVSRPGAAVAGVS
jgi:glutaconate CoA-transferase subunit A